jgi:hypothetical protein
VLNQILGEFLFAPDSSFGEQIRRYSRDSIRIMIATLRSMLEEVELSPQLVGVMKELQPAQREFWFKESKDVPEWIFCKHNQSAPNHGVWRRAFMLIQAKAKVQIRRVHDIRRLGKSNACCRKAFDLGISAARA